MKKIQRGGVRLKNGYTIEFAIFFFLENSTFSLLTNDSISAITLVIHLNHGIESPFISSRSNNLYEEIRNMLIKIEIISTNRDRFFHIKNRNHEGIEIISKEKFDFEIHTQHILYNKSFLSNEGLFDPICPAIIACFNNIDSKMFNFLKNLPGLSNVEQRQLNEILNATLLETVSGISIILMELMEGFETAENILSRSDISNERKTFFYYCIQYEFHRLNLLEYKHDDAHFKNVLININYPYFSKTDPNKFGRALIIDFGRTKKFNLIFETDENKMFIEPTLGWRIPHSNLLTQEMFDTLKMDRINYFKDIVPEINRILERTVEDESINELIKYLRPILTASNYDNPGFTPPIEKQHIYLMEGTIASEAGTASEAGRAIKTGGGNNLNNQFLIINQLKTINKLDFINILKKELEPPFIVNNLNLIKKNKGGKNRKKKTCKKKTCKKKTCKKKTCKKK